MSSRADRRARLKPLGALTSRAAPAFNNGKGSMTGATEMTKARTDKVETVSLSRLRDDIGHNDTPTSGYVVYDAGAEMGGVSFPAGFGDTVEAAYADARHIAEQIGVPEANLCGPVYLIVADK
jgi:hypothetical protein